MEVGEYQSLDMSYVRRKEMEKIGEENRGIGMRLAKVYDMKRKKGYVPEIAKHKGNGSVYLRFRKLPMLLEEKREKGRGGRNGKGEKEGNKENVGGEGRYEGELGKRKTMSLSKIKTLSEFRK